MSAAAATRSGARPRILASDSRTEGPEIANTPTAPTHWPSCMIGTPPCTGKTGMPSIDSRPPEIRSSQVLVERRDTAEVRPLPIAISAFAPTRA